MTTSYLMKRLFGFTLSSLASPRTRTSSGGNPSSSLFRSMYSSSTFSAHHDSDHSSFVGWWAGVSEDHKDPFGQIIHISVDNERYLARSYSPWQFATAKDGTPLFEIYVTTGLNGEYMEQAIHLKCKHEKGDEDAGDVEDMDSAGFWKDLEFGLRFIKAFTTDADADRIMKKVISNLMVTNEATKDKLDSSRGDSYCSTKNAIFIEFAVGGMQEKNIGTLHKKLLRVPIGLERKCSFSFCLKVEEDKEKQIYRDKLREGYRCMDNYILNVVDTVGREQYLQSKKDDGKVRSFIFSQAENQLPVLSGSTIFKRIIIPESSDALNGLYIGSNGYLVTEVIQIRRKFGRWHENDDILDHSKFELYDYVEAVKLIGDPDVPAGKVAFRAKIGEEYKVPPGDFLDNRFNVVARYKGQGRLAGFQNARWVDGELFILGGEYLKDGFALGFLYSASEYYLLKLFKKLELPSTQESH